MSNKIPFSGNLDHYYYLVNGQKTHSRIKALEMADGDIGRIYWYSMDHVWAGCDWTQNPSLSWRELLRIRCQQLRDKYSYLSLWYSSGYDSHTILMAFLENGIPLDEIIIRDHRDFMEDPEFDVALANAHYVKSHYWPNLNINVVVLDWKTNLKFYDTHGDQWIFMPGEHSGIAKWGWYLRNLDPYHLKNTNGKFNRGEITGFEKPKVLLRDGKWYAFFPEEMSFDFIGNESELFYVTPDLPELHIKQSWMAVQWFESQPNLNEDFVHLVQGRDVYHPMFVGNFEAWNLGFGRTPLINHHERSITGTQKFTNCGQYEANGQGRKLISHLTAETNASHQIYLQGIENIKAIKNRYNGNTRLMSKQWYIKDLQS